jgi:hypothetical protein
MEGGLVALKPREVADDGAGAALALEAMANPDSRWFALNGQVKLPARAGSASGDH